MQHIHISHTFLLKGALWCFLVNKGVYIQCYSLGVYPLDVKYTLFVIFWQIDVHI